MDTRSFMLAIFVAVISKASLSNATKEQYYGSFIGRLSNQEQGIAGELFAVDENTVYLRNFTYSGTGSVAIFVYAGTLGEDGGYTNDGYALRNVQGAVQRLGRSNTGEDHVLKFPEGRNLFNVDWLGIVDRKNKALYSRVLVDANVKKSIPSPIKAPPLLGRNGLSSSEVVILDSRTLVIKEFTFKGLAPDTHFLVGVAGTIPNDIDGFIIPDERGTNEALGSYENQTIILSIPPDKPDLHKAKWLSIWSSGIKISLAHTLFPGQELVVPPALDTIGVEPESTLNCERLSEEIGLELRWTLSDEDIILQLVSNTGNDRYIALGVKDVVATQGIAGDVIVGWISSKTGKGGIDDYFLAGNRIKCDDGAESCPDKTKGGTNDVELLNAVSRANYTMLTIRRPILAQGAFDVDVNLDSPQSTFWSVGYKSADKRKSSKPIKNDHPVYIHFGRKPSWNCPEEVAEEPVKQDKSNDMVPRRRIETQEILTPPISSTPKPILMTFRPGPPIRPTPVPGASLVTQSPVPMRKKPIKSNPWTDWLTPPTKPEVQSAGFSPRQRPVLPRVASAKPVGGEWEAPNIGCDLTAEKPLYVHLGPATSARGNQGLGIDGTAMYVNGILAPELTLQRGQEYTFVIETGLGTDPDETFHPFYITDDNSGGRQIKTDLEAKSEKVYGGVTLDRSGSLVPSAMGKLCRWSSPRSPMTFASYKDFHASLRLQCEKEPQTMATLLKSTQVNNPSIMKFVPDNTMPDELFYQSFMAKHLGGSIKIIDYCYNTVKSPEGIVTYRPSIEDHFKSAAPSTTRSRVRLNDMEILSRSESRRRATAGGRRIDYDDDAYDYDINDFDQESKKNLYNKCRRLRGRSLKNDQMPTFEHFPMRDLIRSSGIDDELMPTEEECHQITLDQEPLLASKVLSVQNRVRETPAPSRSEEETTTQFSFVKARSPSPVPQFHSTTTTSRPKAAITTPSNWNSQPFSSYQQLDPSLLHNGFLYDKRELMANYATTSDARPMQIFSTSKPMFAKAPGVPISATGFPKQATTVPTLPPPGGDIPPYMTLVNEAKAKFQDSQKITLAPPPILKKIPLPMSTPEPFTLSKETPAQHVEQSGNPFSMLSNILMPKWFQEEPNEQEADYEERKQETRPKIELRPTKEERPHYEKRPTIEQRLPTQYDERMKLDHRPLYETKKQERPKNDDRSAFEARPMMKDVPKPKQRPQKEGRPYSSSGIPMLPPPGNFPSFQQALQKKHQNGRPKKPSNPNRKQQHQIPDNYADFVKNEFKKMKFQESFPNQRPPLFQFIAKKEGEAVSRHQQDSRKRPPRRQMKVEPKRKGLLDQIMSLPETLHKLPYLGSSVSVQSVESGNATVKALSEIEMMKEEADEDEYDEEFDFTDEEKAILKQLSEMPTSVSSDLMASYSNSFPISEPSSSSATEKIKGPSKLPTTLGLGFDPTAIEPESGFKPIVERQGSSIPTLAFSVMDTKSGDLNDPVSAGVYEQDYLRRRQGILDQIQINAHKESTMQKDIDRSLAAPVNVPSPVVAYAPAASKSKPLPTDKPQRSSEKARRRNKKPPSADFSSFEDGSRDEESDDYEYDPGYKETDRIDVQTPLVIDPYAYVYSQSSAPYGQQFPSYVSDSLHTMVGTLGDANKHFTTSDNVVYGKFPEGSDASKNINIVKSDYEDQFEYYDDKEDEYYYYDDETAVKGLKDRLGIAATDTDSANAAQDKSMSFLQLLNNLRGNNDQ